MFTHLAKLICLQSPEVCYVYSHRKYVTFNSYFLKVEHTHPRINKRRFIFSDNIVLATGKTLDYETLNYYRLALYVTDTMASSGPYYLAVHVLDDPEVCTFPQTLYRYDTYEAGVSISDDMCLD